MTGRTHDLAAVTALAATVVLHPIGDIRLSTACIALLANQIGGIIPDVDQPTAPFWRNLPIGKIFGQFFGKTLGGHRFLTHSLLGVGLLGVLCKVVLNFLNPLMPNTDIGYVWWAFMIGLISHLIMDSFTEEGVPWLLPLPIKFGFPPIKRMRIVTGKWFENLVIFPVLIFVNFWLIASHYGQILGWLQNRLVG